MTCPSTARGTLSGTSGEEATLSVTRSRCSWHQYASRMARPSPNLDGGHRWTSHWKVRVLTRVPAHPLSASGRRSAWLGTQDVVELTHFHLVLWHVQGLPRVALWLWWSCSIYCLCGSEAVWFSEKSCSQSWS